MDKEREIVTIDIVRPTGPRVIAEPLRTRGYLERYIPRRSVSRAWQGAVALSSVLRRPRIVAAGSTLALAVICHLVVSSASHFVAAPFWVFTASNKAAMDPQPAASYSGPNDAVSGAAVFYSCARAYNATYANGTNSLCDLVDSAAPTVVICTLRVATTGFADLTGAYCTGSVTPAVKCAAATSGVCNISKAYNQVAPGTNDATNATSSSQPRLTFSALGGLPGITCTNAASSALTTTGTVTQALPWTINAVAERTGNFTTTGGVFGENASGNNDVQFTTSTNTIGLHFGATLGTQAASDSAFHSLQGVGSASANQSIMVVDNTASAGITGTAVGVAQPMRLCRSSGSASSMTGIIMEAGLWNIAFNSGQYGAMNTNHHSSTNGYNF